jgi:N-formylglutamate deformylase
MPEHAEKLFHLREGGLPLVVSIPHAGTYLPDDVQARLTPVGRAVVDTDWHVDKLYEFLQELDVTVLTATHSRNVVDLNRSPHGGKLYPGQTETGICPTESFAGEALYEGAPPDAAEIARRVSAYWQPYHDALAGQIARLREAHGWVRVLDGHSIRAEVPRLFEGALPDLNFGTHEGAACEAWLAERAVAAAGDTFSKVLNGRFKGGFITRHYGVPSAGVQVVQLEMAQRIYMDEAAPRNFDAARAAALVEVLRRVVGALAGR